MWDSERKQKAPVFRRPRVQVNLSSGHMLFFVSTRLTSPHSATGQWTDGFGLWPVDG